jgi:integrase
VRSRYPHLHRRGDIFYFFWRTDEGKRIEESLRTRDAETANEKYKQRMNEIGSGRSPNDLGGWTLEQASKLWLERRQLQIARGSYRSEQSIVRNLLRVFGPASRLRLLADIAQFRNYQHHRLKESVLPKTVNNELQVLMGILRLAHLAQRVCDYKPLRTRKSDEPRALTTEESKRLLQVAAGSRPTSVAPFAAVLAWSAGVRSGEIKQLRLGVIHHDVPRPFLVVRRATTKSDAGARRVALDRIAVWAIRKLLDRAALIGSVNPEDHLLPTDRARHTRASDPLHGEYGFDPGHAQSSWEWEWKAFKRAAEINCRFHDLRHSYISRAAEAGVPIAVVQAQVGHMSTEMVKWYTHISEGAQYKAAIQIEAQNPEFAQVVIGTPRTQILPQAVTRGGSPTVLRTTEARLRCRVSARDGSARGSPAQILQTGRRR